MRFERVIVKLATLDGDRSDSNIDDRSVDRNKEMINRGPTLVVTKQSARKSRQ